ncbi:hypothetical protein IFVP18_C1190047 [Vibrio parahaemolyticus]
MRLVLGNSFLKVQAEWPLARFYQQNHYACITEPFAMCGVLISVS